MFETEFLISDDVLSYSLAWSSKGLAGVLPSSLDLLSRLDFRMLLMGFEKSASSSSSYLGVEGSLQNKKLISNNTYLLVLEWSSILMAILVFLFLLLLCFF